MTNPRYHLYRFRIPRLAKELVFMGASLSPITDNPEFVNSPRHEFNIWFDPEADQVGVAKLRPGQCHIHVRVSFFGNDAGVEPRGGGLGRPRVVGRR